MPENEISPVVMNRSVEEVARWMENYWSTYMEQSNVKTYQSKTIFEDALYSVASAISVEYRGPYGFNRFRADLERYLTGESGDTMNHIDDVFIRKYHSLKLRQKVQLGKILEVLI